MAEGAVVELVKYLQKLNPLTTPRCLALRETRDHKMLSFTRTNRLRHHEGHMKRTPTLLILALLVATLSSCAGPPKAYQINNTSTDLNSSGVAFFRVTGQRFFGLFQYNRDTGGRGVGVKNRITGKDFNCVARPYCEMKLPPGIYEISVLGSPAGGLLPKEKAFSFTVEAGVVKYLGFIVGDSDLLEYLEKHNLSAQTAYQAVIASQEYGLSRPRSFFDPESIPGEPFIPFFIIDNREVDIDVFLGQYSQFSKEKIIFDPLR